MNAASGIDVGTIIGATEVVNRPLLHAALPIVTLFLLKIGGLESYLESRLVAPKMWKLAGRPDLMEAGTDHRKLPLPTPWHSTAEVDLALFIWAHN
eukprot:CAMPEP_0183335230 /NCGR_PEP_ID=MMETSP0164_2-20130417/3601_1 /TAXON_ID=221442 /ORGANISM="Coccolithus pelagicus ssp braarudi, Strain PLY182g" /LENGTH=95 /DNA_ID=CAMNT_0025504553 /DNA_START=329 /DNA_END=616 /DNA_ORIENTATION=+